jgi:hypothetical protein
VNLALQDLPQVAALGDNGTAQAAADKGSGDLIQVAIIDDHPLARLA